MRYLYENVAKRKEIQCFEAGFDIYFPCKRITFHKNYNFNNSICSTCIVTIHFFPRYSAPQSSNVFKTGRTVLPKSVIEYSTFGGISGYIFLATSPSASSSLSCFVSIFGDTSGMSCWILLYRKVSLASRHSIMGFHLPPMTFKVASMGQLQWFRVQ